MLTINGWLGEVEVYIVKDAYTSNDNTAIQLLCYDEEFDFIEPWATLTVNLEDLPEELCYLDTNNVPNAEEFMQKYGIGSPTGLYTTSGFCTYPLYLIDMNRLNELVAESEKERSELECTKEQ